MADEMQDQVAAALFRWMADDAFPSYNVSREDLPSGRTPLAPFEDQDEQTIALFREGADVVIRAAGERERPYAEWFLMERPNAHLHLQLAVLHWDEQGRQVPLRSCLKYVIAQQLDPFDLPKASDGPFARTPPSHPAPEPGPEHRAAAKRELVAPPEGCANPSTVDGEEQMCAECVPCLDYIAEYWYRVATDLSASREREEEVRGWCGHPPMWHGYGPCHKPAEHDGPCAFQHAETGRLAETYETFDGLRAARHPTAKPHRAEAAALLFNWLNNAAANIRSSYLSPREQKANDPHRLDVVWEYTDPDEFALAVATRKYLASVGFEAPVKGADEAADRPDSWVPKRSDVPGPGGTP